MDLADAMADTTAQVKKRAAIQPSETQRYDALTALMTKVEQLRSIGPKREPAAFTCETCWCHFTFDEKVRNFRPSYTQQQGNNQENEIRLKMEDFHANVGKKEKKQRMKTTKPNHIPLNSKKAGGSVASILFHPFSCCVKSNSLDQSFEEPELRQLFKISSFTYSNMTTDTQTSKSKMQTQNWILPHDLHLLIKILKNIINQMNNQEQGVEIANTDIRLLFYLDFKPVKFSKRKFVNPTETSCECTEPSVSDNIEENSLKQTTEKRSLQNINGSRSVSIQSHNSTNTLEEFHFIINFAWKLFIIKVVKQLNTRIRKEALYSTLRTVTAYAVSSVQKPGPKMHFLPTPRTIIKNDSMLSLKMNLTEELEIHKSHDNKSVLSIHASISNIKHKQIRRKEENSLMKLFLKHFKPKHAMSESVKESIKLISPSPSLSSVTSTSGTRTTGSTLPSEDSIEKEIVQLEQNKTPHKGIEDVPKMNVNSIKTESSLQQLIETDFIITSSVKPSLDLNKLSNIRRRVEEPIPSSQSASNRSNYYLDAASTRAVTQKKLEEIEKKSSLFYEILSYVYDKILSRKSSKDETDVTVSLKNRALSKLNFSSVKPSGDSQTTLQEITADPPLEKEIKTSFGRLLFSNSHVHSITHFDIIPPTKNEIKNKVLGQTMMSKRQPKKKIKSKQEKTNKKTRKLSKKDKQEEHLQKDKPMVLEINVNKNNSSSSLKTSSSIVTDECGLSPVSIVCGPRHNVSSSVSSEFCSSKFNASHLIPPTIELQESVDKSIFQQVDEIPSKEARHLKISVAQNTSFSCLRKRYRHKLFQHSENKKNCKCLDEQKLKELLRIILKEIDSEKEKKKALRNLKREEQKMTSSTSTRSLELRVTRSKCTQSSRSNTFDYSVSVPSASSILHREQVPSTLSKTNLQAVMDSPVRNSCKFVTCNHPMKEYVPTFEDESEKKALETNSVLDAVPLINLQDEQLTKTSIWDDCYEKDVDIDDKLSKLKLSEFTLIFNLLTVRKNKHKFQKQFIDVIVTETETSNIENEMRSSSDYSGNFSLMPVYEQRNKEILKKDKNKNEHGSSLKQKRRLSNAYYDCDSVQNKKSSSEFEKNTDLLRFKYNDKHFQPQKLAKNGRVSQTFKIQKVSSHSFTSGAGNGRLDDFEHSLGKVAKTIKKNYRLIPSNRIFIDDAVKPNTNVENTFRTGTDKSVHTELPPIAYYNSSKPQGSLKISTNSKNKHVTWNFLHLPY
ncbi:hypothetical protein FQR65_LT00884 [Abscondita terminalis]|nr:hypothetical protein FQR65_LT00884 [Abscondita terminalis]